MTTAPPLERKEKFVHRYLDPAGRLGEVLFGLIMVLTMTLTAEIAADDQRASAKELLVAAIGCNIAWGFIDAIMFIMAGMTERSGRVRLMREVKAAPDEDAAMSAIRRTIEPEIDALSAPEDREPIYRSMFKYLKDGTETKVSITREDVIGALVCFWLVFLSCLPAAIPFLVMGDAYRALRVSNFLLVAMLFIVGWKWAGYTGANRVGTSLSMVAIGLVLVGLAVLLGG